MCQITSNTELKIQGIIDENRKGKRKPLSSMPFQENFEPIVENLELINRLNSIFDQ